MQFSHSIIKTYSYMHSSELFQYRSCILCNTELKDLSFVFLFAITATGVVPCGSPKMSPRTSSIVPIIFSFWSFEISEGILRNQKIIIGLDSFSNQSLIYFALFGLY